jgi:DNA-directed RNA polymerase specialized sigma subunit
MENSKDLQDFQENNQGFTSSESTDGADGWLSKEELGDLVAEAKTDEQRRLDLWYEVERFADMVTGRYSRPDNAVLTSEDYHQLAWFGFLNAVRLFNPDKHDNFLGWLHFAIRKECWQEYQRMCIKHPRTVSLNNPIEGEDGMAGELVDFVVDEKAGEAFAYIEVGEDAYTILTLAQGLPNLIETEIVYRHIYGGWPLQTIADDFGISKQLASQYKRYAISNLRRKPAIRKMIDSYNIVKYSYRTNPYRKVNKHFFDGGGRTSVQERIALYKEGVASRLKPD